MFPSHLLRAPKVRAFYLILSAAGGGDVSTDRYRGVMSINASHSMRRRRRLMIEMTTGSCMRWMMEGHQVLVPVATKARARRQYLRGTPCRGGESGEGGGGKSVGRSRSTAWTSHENGAHEHPEETEQGGSPGSARNTGGVCSRASHSGLVSRARPSCESCPNEVNEKISFFR